MSAASAVTLDLDPAEVLALHGFLALGLHFEAILSEENSPFSPDAIRSYTAAISTNAATVLIDKIFAIAAVIDTHIGNELEMNALTDPPDGGHYRELAAKLRRVAHRCRFTYARQEILDLATRYERKARHFDNGAAAGLPNSCR